MSTAIEWAEETWNPVTGCTKVSPGCDNCYAERLTEQWYGKGAFAKVELHDDRLRMPLRWKAPRRIFVNSMSDLFHKDVPDEFITRVLRMAVDAPQHQYLILTKRHDRMASFMRRYDPNRFPNVWLGVSVEDQKRANLRIDALLDVLSVRIRFLSCEPLLGPIDLSPLFAEMDGRWFSPIHWVIVGGESDYKHPRPMHPDWARSIRDQCREAGVPFFFKQHGGSTKINGHWGGNTLDGRTWQEYPPTSAE
jgi:protein gp37